MTTKEMVEAPAKPKSDIEARIEQLKKIKKRPEDWVFVPRRKGHDNASVMLEDGDYALVSDGSGGFKSHTRRRPLKVKVSQVRSVTAKGEIIGGFRPKKLGEGDDAWTPEEVLEAFIELSLNPKCEIVPYEAREMTKETKDAQSDLLEERRKRIEAEDKLRALEDADGIKAARIKELEKAIEENGKPPKK